MSTTSLTTRRGLLFPLCIASALACRAQSPVPGPVEADSHWSVHAQSTGVEQWHGSFTAPYSGQNSLEAKTTEDKHTATATLFLGYQAWAGGSLYFNPEMTQGNGLSGAVGLAGFPNGEATRAGSNSPEFNTARLYFQQVIGLGGKTETLEDDLNQVKQTLDVNRLTVTVGKFAAVDFFDDNAYSHDPRTQFLNWALMDSGAWDYAADTKGYTGGLVVEWNTEAWALRYGLMMEPLEANGLELDHHLSKAFAQVLEWDFKYSSGTRSGVLRPFVFLNDAHMGSYAKAVSSPVYGMDVTQTRAYRSKYGVGLSWDQTLTDTLGAFARLSWNDGATESWAFTEIDRSAVLGLSDKGADWGRPNDVLGVALDINGLSGPHRAYLAAGGYGFIVGDGRLSYATENILEAYYSFQVLKWLSIAPDFQYAQHPGYNRDRGPVAIYAVRAHLQF